MRRPERAALSRVKKGPSDAFSPVGNERALRLSLRSRGLVGVETLATQG